MGCQSKVVLGANLTFTITTHDPDTGVLTDADGAPTYRVYEDETAAAILNGTMTKLDDANTMGFYSALIACTAGNGFDVDKSYNIYIEATVDGDTGGISYGFTLDPTDALTTILANVAAILNDTGTSGVLLADNSWTRDAIAPNTGYKSLRSNTTQASTASTITLDAGATAFDDRYNGLLIRIYGGTGNGQTRVCTDYNGTTKVAMIAPDWDTNPDVTSTFAILPFGYIAGIAGTANILDDLNDLSAADVNAEVLDVLNVDTFAEPGQGAPPATATFVQKIGYLYKMFRNKIMQDATVLEIYNDAGAVVDQKATISDDGTDYTRGGIGSGP